MVHGRCEGGFIGRLVEPDGENGCGDGGADEAGAGISGGEE